MFEHRGLLVSNLRLTPCIPSLELPYHDESLVDPLLCSMVHQLGVGRTPDRPTASGMSATKYSLKKLKKKSLSLLRASLSDPNTTYFASTFQ